MPQSEPDNTPLEPRLCPVCSASDRRLLHRQEFAAFSSGSLLDRYDVVACSGCGFVFADRIPSQPHFDRYYREMSKYEHHHRFGLEPDWVLDRYEVTADILRPFMSSPRTRVLDVGCAAGGLLGCLKRRGYPNVLGFDPSPACAKAAERIHGVRVLPRTLADLALEQERHDVIVLAGVLEHVRDLGQAVADVRRLLLPGGVLYVEVPDATAFVGCRNAPFQEFSIEHINFFSEQSLANLMAGHHLRLETAIKQPRELSRDAIEPCLLVAFRNVDAALPVVFDDQTEPAIRNYVDESNRVDRRVREVVADAARRQESVLVWGVGAHTLRLLATSELARARVTAFVDSNQNYVGKTVNGVPVIAPQTLRGRREPILISSYVYQEEIADTIRGELGLENELIRLYEIQGAGNPETGKQS